MKSEENVLYWKDFCEGDIHVSACDLSSGLLRKIKARKGTFMHKEILAKKPLLTSQCVLGLNGSRL